MITRLVRKEHAGQGVPRQISQLYERQAVMASNLRKSNSARLPKPGRTTHIYL